MDTNEDARLLSKRALISPTDRESGDQDEPTRGRRGTRNS